MPCAQPYAYNDWEIIHECEEGDAHYGRSWYNLNNVEIVYFNPFRTYVRTEDLGERGIQPYFAKEDAPYLIEHPTHSNFECLYCGRSMNTPWDDDEYDPYPQKRFFESKSHEGYSREHYHCHGCGWWLIDFGFRASSDDDMAWSLNESIYIQGVLRRFDVASADAALEDLAFWLTRHRESISDIDPYRFEDLVKAALAEKLGAGEVRKIGGRKDRGIDLLLYEGSGDPIVVQVKRRSHLNRAESVATVRDLNGVLLRERVPNGMIITTSKSFSPDAVREVQETRRNHLDGPFSRYRVDLVNLNEFLELLGQSKLDEKVYTRHLMTETFEEWAEKFGVERYSRFRRLWPDR